MLESRVVRPAFPPPAGRAYYLPEGYYFGLEADFTPERLQEATTLLKQAAFVTVRCVAQWADRYVAYPFLHEGIPPEEWQRAGALPTDEQARAALIADLFAWFERLDVWLNIAEVDLYQGEEAIFYQHNGMPGLLILTAEQFAEVQAAWEREGLPRDLYYPLSEERVVVEPTEQDEGRVILAYRRYSPLCWALRDEAVIAALRVPSEEERKQAFTEAWMQFMGTINCRLAELREPERPQPKESQRVVGVLRDVGHALLRYSKPEAYPEEEQHELALTAAYTQFMTALARRLAEVERSKRPDDQAQQQRLHHLLQEVTQAWLHAQRWERSQADKASE
jgi:hypothetical protein